MFEDSLVESTHRLPSQSRWSFAVSIGLQAVLATLIVTIPLLHPETLQRLALAPPMLLAPPAPVPPPPPVRVMVRAEDASGGSAAPAIPQLVTATGHSIVDTFLRPQVGTEVPPGVMTTSMMGAGEGSPMVPGLDTGEGRPSVAVATPKMVRLSGGVTAGMLLAPIQPVYPAIAKAAHMEGTVVIHAIISKSGSIESASVMSGPVMLQGAAIEAVRAAHYRPYRLNGEPAEVETTISINFRLSS